jgi:putative transposase
MTEYRRRNTLRYVGYDYTNAGAYFVTFRVHRGLHLFGEVVNGVMILSPLGRIADQCWVEFAERHTDARVDVHVIMPNHGHVLLWLMGASELADPAAASKTRKFGDAIAGSLSSLMGAYKSAVTQQAVNRGLIAAPPLWQRNFYDHIVRGDQELERIREYIRQNPARWQHGREVGPEEPYER